MFLRNLKLLLLHRNQFLVVSFFFVTPRALGKIAPCEVTTLTRAFCSVLYVVELEGVNLKTFFIVYGFLYFSIDHDRPLSKAGQADAKIVSQKLQQLGWIPQLILSRCGYDTDNFGRTNAICLEFFDHFSVLFGVCFVAVMHCERGRRLRQCRNKCESS